MLAELDAAAAAGEASDTSERDTIRQEFNNLLDTLETLEKMEPDKDKETESMPGEKTKKDVSNEPTLAKDPTQYPVTEELAVIVPETKDLVVWNDAKDNDLIRTEPGIDFKIEDRKKIDEEKMKPESADDMSKKIKEKKEELGLQIANIDKQKEEQRKTVRESPDCDSKEGLGEEKNNYRDSIGVPTEATQNNVQGDYVADQSIEDEASKEDRAEEDRAEEDRTDEDNTDKNKATTGVTGGGTGGSTASPVNGHQEIEENRAEEKRVDENQTDADEVDKNPADDNCADINP